MGSKGTQTSTQESTTRPDDQAYAAYQNLLQRASGVASTPYQPYTGELVAPVNAQQNLGIGSINASAGYAQPYYTSAIQQAQNASQPLTAAGIQQYMSPYTQNVVDATQAQFNNQNAQALQQVKGNAIAQGALGGNREAIAEANTLGQLQLSQAPTIAGLYNSGYNQAVNTAQQQQALGLQGAGTIGSLAGAGQNAGLSGGAAQMGAGQVQQNTQQLLDQALLQQYQQAQAFPYQQAQWLAGMQTGVGSQMGGTSSGTTTQPGPSGLSSILGGITSGIGMLGSLGLFSDERVKENVKTVGKTFDGQRIVRFNYKGDPTTRIGFIAQEVERKHPEAVGSVDGIKTVDYKEATKDAVKHKSAGGVASFASGGGVATSPFGDAPTWIPSMNIAHGSGAPQGRAPSGVSNQQGDMSKQMASIGDFAKQVGGFLNPTAWGGSIADGAWGGSSSSPLPGLSASDYGPGFARGGVASFADGGSVDELPDMVERASRFLSNGRDRGQRALYNDTRAGLWNSATAPDEGSTYGGLGAGLNERRRHDMFEAQSIADRMRGYADGGVVDPLEDRFAAVQDALKSGEFDPQGINYTAFNAPPPPVAPVVDEQPTMVAEPQGVAPAPQVASRGLPPEITGGSSTAEPTPSSAMSYADETPTTSEGVAPSFGSNMNWGSDSKLWPSLISAGFGMMASRSPSVGGAIGEGGLAGVASYNAQQKADFEARKFAEEQGLQQAQQALRERADSRAQQQADRAAGTASLVPDGSGGYKVNPAYLELKRQEAEITQRDSWTPVGSVMSGDSVHPLVMNKVNGTVLDAVTGKPPQPGDRIATTGKGGTNVDPAAVAKVATGIITGRQPPTLKGLYGMSGPVRAQLEAEGFDLSKAELEYKTAEKQIASLNGPQQVRFAGLAISVSKTIDRVRQLSKELQNSGVPLLNKAKLTAYMQTMGNTPQGQLAAQYMASVNTLKEEFANLANGGYAPTEAAWKLANDQINGNFGVKQLGASLDEIQRLIHYRVNAVPGINTIGPGAANRYTGRTGEPLMEDLGHGTPTTPVPTNKPARVRQNGHTYELQPDGKYKAID